MIDVDVVSAPARRTPSPGLQAFRDLPAVLVLWVPSILFLPFLSYFFRCSNLVLAAMKSAAASADSTSPTFGSQASEDPR